MTEVDERLEGNRAELERVLLADPFAARIGAEVTGWGGGWARAELQVAPEHTNLAGTAHGGVTFSLGDLVLAVSSNSWGRLSVALTVEVQYLASVEVGTRLIAESRERHRTKRTGAYLIELRSSASHDPTTSASHDPATAASDDPREGGPLVASLHALVHRTDRWHLGDQAWSQAWRAAH